MTATVHSLHARRTGVVSLKLYRPRWYQGELHRARARFNVWVCHRRFGKTVMCVNELIKELVLLGAARRERPRVGYIAPFYRQAKRVAWDYVRHYTAPIRGRKVRESELAVDVPWGGRISLYGADNPDSLRGEYFDLVVLDEVAQMAPRLWTEVIRPALADRQGGAIFIGTPWGRRNLFHRLWEHAAEAEHWHRAMYTVEATDALTDEELVALRAEMSEAEFRQELMCDWDAATPGAYYAKQLKRASEEGRIGEFPYQRNVPVTTAWDFGIADPTVVGYFQTVGAQERCIGVDAIADLSLPEILAHIRANRPYSFARHLVPHDANQRQQGIVGAPTRLDIMAEHGFSAELVPTKSLEEGIEKTRIGLDRMQFDAKPCTLLLEALRLYRSEYDDLRGVYRPKPVHDWSSHYADMMRTYFQARASHEVLRYTDEELHQLNLEIGVGVI